jgi:hypothetical protein
MEEYLNLVIYLVFLFGVIKFLRKNIWKNAGVKGTGNIQGQGNVPARGVPSPGSYQQARPAQSSAMPHQHKPAGKYESYSKKTHNRQSGAMPHKHEKDHYTSMPDVSTLPPGYILLNGEPVRVADLEGK